MASARAARTVAAGGAAAIVVAALRARSLRWGATDEELVATLPGDELVPHPDLTTTRAVTVNARAADVWPWIAQLGQGRGGFYSYDALENLVGCDIHSADRIVPAWQGVAVGAKSVSPRGRHDRGRRRTGPRAGAARRDAGNAPVRLHLGVRAARGTGRDHAAGVRERYGYLRWWAPMLVVPVE